MEKIRRVCLIALITFGIPASIVFAQDGRAGGSSEESPFGVITIPVEKIYYHSKGYVVEYRKNGMGTERIYLPLSWFRQNGNTETTRKGELIKIKNGNVWPYISVYYRDGKTDHVRLYVRDNAHQTRGAIPNSVNLDDKFDGVEEITISR